MSSLYFACSDSWTISKEAPIGTHFLTTDGSIYGFINGENDEPYTM